MQYTEALMFEKAAISLEAQENLLKLTISDYPNIKSDERRKIHKDIYRKAFPNDNNMTSIAEMERILKGE